MFLCQKHLPEKEYLGLGVTVEIDGLEIKVGSLRFIQQATDNRPLPSEIQTAMQAAVGNTFILIAINGEIQGALELHPRLRPEVPTLIKALNMDAAYGEILPQDKAALIQQLQAQLNKFSFTAALITAEFQKFKVRS